MPDEAVRKLLWRCRRGMKELDVVLERYARAHLEAASEEERRVFARLLDLPDPDLAEYFLGHAIPDDPALAHLTRLITTHRA
jgi:antitoxin CptB